MATGRKPNTRNLGLEKAGVKIDENGAVIVDEELRTTSPAIWAAGDVIGEPMLETETERILGVHIVASLAADMIHEGVLAVKYGLTIDDIIDTVHVFPTMTEALKLVAQSFRKDVSKISCCAE